MKHLNAWLGLRRKNKNSHRNLSRAIEFNNQRSIRNAEITPRPTLLAQLFCTLATIGLLLGSPGFTLSQEHQHTQMTEKVETPPTEIIPGCEFTEIAIPASGETMLAMPPEISSANKELRHTLDVRYANNTIADCQVQLRSYNGRVTAETLRAKPGDTLRITLNNNLPNMVSNAGVMPAHAMHSDFNSTNLHTHGLHVSPQGNEDNPLLNIHPGKSFAYEIHIPKNQPPGTFWYHAHLHGATSVQLSSGMSGALIITGGLDDVPQIKAAKEQILVVQQISYNQSGKLENFDEAFGPDRWRQSRRLTTINGQVAPTIVMRPGEIQRWRIIHAGTRENLSLRLENHALNEIATDGIALGRIVPWKQPLLLSPGNRSDVLVQADNLPASEAEQTFDLIDEESPAAETIQGQQGALAVAMQSRGKLTIDDSLRSFPSKPRQVLAHIVVSGKPVKMKMPSEKTLAKLAPYKDISDAELTGEPQKVTFDVAFAACDASTGECKTGCAFGSPGCSIAYMVNGRQFSESHKRVLKVGQAAEWMIDAKLAVHPFHIHVNDFQLSRMEPGGKQHKIWKDTLLISAGQPPTKIRMRYEDFTGTTVLHCHILDHEDQGMMELIELVK